MEPANYTDHKNRSTSVKTNLYSHTCERSEKDVTSGDGQNWGHHHRKKGTARRIPVGKPVTSRSTKWGKRREMGELSCSVYSGNFFFSACFASLSGAKSPSYLLVDFPGRDL